ncbi:amidase signature domain-containing protein [Aspergillus karnatakaensis]|uniref:amidase signature domain-containing protein n=1 Tax=Aspergillus karnatakaensis TaxID=1810916 RepID=UPI003CCCD678
MSTITLSPDAVSTVTGTDLQAIASRFDIKINPEEESAYLLLLQSADAVYNSVAEYSEEIPPVLKPVDTVEPRTFVRPTAEENPLNAWSHVCNLQAMAPTSDLLKGRTVAIKDNVCVGGLPTTLGVLSAQVSKTGGYVNSDIDAVVVSRLLQAGAVVKGTAVCEAYSAAPTSFTSATGIVNNPWAKEPGYTAGGSSSGCGALLGATAMREQGVLPETDSNGVPTVELAVGGDQGGSIRLPAAYNGVYGLKATHGLIPYTGAMGIAPMIDHLGPMATKLDDIAVMLQVMAGYDGLDARMTPDTPKREQVKNYPGILKAFRESFQAPPAAEPRPLRIGLLLESYAAPGLSPQVRDTVLQAAKQAFSSAGAIVKEISIPMHHRGPLIWTAATRKTMGDFAVSGETPGYLTWSPSHMDLKWPPDQAMYEQMSKTNPTIMSLIFCAAYLKEKFGPSADAAGHRAVYALRAAYDAVLEDAGADGVDVLITPTVPTVSFKCPYLDSQEPSVMDRVKAAVGHSYNTCPFNVTGHPAMSVPCGFGQSEDGKERLPIGMQIIGRRWHDETVLKAAALFERGMELS